MKKLLFAIVVMLITNVSFSQTSQVSLSEMSTVASQIHVSYDTATIKQAVIRSSNVNENTFIQNLSSSTGNYDFSRAKVFQIDLVNGEFVKSFEIPSFNNDYEILNFISLGDGYILQNATKEYDMRNDSYTIKSISIIAKTESTQSTQSRVNCCRGWVSCMTNGMNTGVGVFITTMGVGSSVGCIPCGVMGASTFGIMALGCAG